MIADKLINHKIILASQSPRRQQLLAETGLKFDVVTREYAEDYPSGLNGEEIARFVAYNKVNCFKDEISDQEIVIAADTIVWFNGQVLGKPVDRDDAIVILKQISGNTHDVITGVSILSVNKEVTFSETTRVTFDVLSDEEIDFYVDNLNPYDKAGAYGIQEWIGIIACSRIEGSYFNVVGLPVHRLCRELEKFVYESNPNPEF